MVYARSLDFPFLLASIQLYNMKFDIQDLTINYFYCFIQSYTSTQHSLEDSDPQMKQKQLELFTQILLDDDIVIDL